jgi:uncharacterized membrane protein YphA (DoxX/SURF4 family)
MSGSKGTCPRSPRPALLRRAWNSRLLTAVCRYVLGALFLAAALTKIPAPAGFEEHLRQSGYLSGRAAFWVARTLPWVELTCGFCLVLGAAVREAALTVALLLILFIAHSVLSQSQADCGCFLTPLPETGHAAWWLLLRNALLLLCSLRVAWHK